MLEVDDSIVVISFYTKVRPFFSKNKDFQQNFSLAYFSGMVFEYLVTFLKKVIESDRFEQVSLRVAVRAVYYTLSYFNRIKSKGNKPKVTKAKLIITEG